MKTESLTKRRQNLKIWKVLGLCILPHKEAHYRKKNMKGVSLIDGDFSVIVHHRVN